MTTLQSTFNPLFVGEQIKELIPQRSPIMMVDTLYESTSEEAITGLTIKEDNLFCKNGKFTEPGLIEHIAQSASAFAGYQARIEGKPAPIGYIGEIKKFHLISFPKTGSSLTTHIKVMGIVGNVTLLQAETTCKNETVCTTGLKIAIEDGNGSKASNISTVEHNSSKYFDLLAQKQESDGEIVSTVKLNPNCEVYRGHFPNDPVCPGVCNLNMLRECIEHYTNTKLTISDIKQCRYTALITPIKHSVLYFKASVSPMEDGFSVQGTVYNETETFIDIKLTLCKTNV
ncbi:MAG: hypothetical protein MJ003_02005 [Paludibacteraceae bacterium]|nr:hypothetical protein [Paludibacteraceae bacterium]